MENVFDFETVKMTSPSGYEFTIREQNGYDDDILSNPADAEKGTGLHKFISNIVVDTDFTKSGKLTFDDVGRLKVYDKFWLIIASRIFSLGPIVNFEYDWGKGPISYVEDLTQFVWDYANLETFPKKDDEDYFKYRIKPHPMGRDNTHEFVISNGTQFRFKALDGNSDLKELKMDSNKRTINNDLLLRDLQIKEGEEWKKVLNFKVFTASKMREIRTEIQKYDPDLEIISEIPNPEKQSQKIQYPIIASRDFFFPQA